MELSWSTFFLEIVNFLVLVWILERFLYRPVRAIVARRRERIEQTLEEARKQREAGEALEAQYDARFADWAREQAAEREKLQHELVAERQRQLAALEQEIEGERSKARTLAEREQAAERAALEARAIAAGARFAARLLDRVADAHVEGRLVDAALADIESSPGDELVAALQACTGEDAQPVEITTAFELGEQQRGAVEQALGRLAGAEVGCRYDTDERLVAGLRMQAGAIVVEANLARELEAFATAGKGTESS